MSNITKHARAYVLGNAVALGFTLWRDGSLLWRFPYCFSLVQRRDFVKHKSIRVSSKKIYNARTLTFAFRHMGPYADGTHSVQDGTHKTRDPYTRRISVSGYRDPWRGKAVDRGEGVGGLPWVGRFRVVLKRLLYGTYAFVFIDLRYVFFLHMQSVRFLFVKL